MATKAALISNSERKSTKLMTKDHGDLLEFYWPGKRMRLQLESTWIYSEIPSIISYIWSGPKIII